MQGRRANVVVALLTKAARVSTTGQGVVGLSYTRVPASVPLLPSLLAIRAMTWRIVKFRSADIAQLTTLPSYALCVVLQQGARRSTVLQKS
ncbi:hypothetical protein BKA70DRAFT_1356193 [Coprinopsis sp. MPI-PUGE-AT-0042]|nr:hypothetical protein BKA70DRAFT_1356193 [Coprinopsis sp. MPI-PUGE-AT-0042]